MEPADILKRPYARVVVPDSDGSFTAEILEFPGCVASGDTAAAALETLEEVGLDWIAAELEQRHNIPEPLDHASYSGKLVVRMPQGLHKRAARAAAREGVSLNQFIVTCVAEQVGAKARPQFTPLHELPIASQLTRVVNAVMTIASPSVTRSSGEGVAYQTSKPLELVYARR